MAPETAPAAVSGFAAHQLAHPYAALCLGPPVVNLHGIVSGAIGTVNPNTAATITPAVGGYVTGADGHRVPATGTPVAVMAQVQALTTKDLQHLDGLNVSGSTHAIYLNGQLQGVVRAGAYGGDTIVLADGRTYLTTAVLELWPDWCKATVMLQRS